MISPIHYRKIYLDTVTQETIVHNQHVAYDGDDCIVVNSNIIVVDQRSEVENPIVPSDDDYKDSPVCILVSTNSSFGVFSVG